VLQRGYDMEYQLQKLLASVTLISRLDAMRLLNLSEAQFDRKAASGEIEVTYVDARPRVLLTELQRFIAVNTQSTAASPASTLPVVTKSSRRRRRKQD